MFFSFAFELSLASHHHPCLMNALFVLRPAKLRAFNFGHPCPSLVKGRWIDGTTQTVVLLLSACDMSTHFILQTFLPSRRRDCYTTTPFRNHTIPSPRTKLASLVKGRWIDGTTQTVVLLLSACDMSTLFILQTFLPSRRRDCYTTTPFRNRTIPPTFRNANIYMHYTLSYTHYPIRFS